MQYEWFEDPSAQEINKRRKSLSEFEDFIMNPVAQEFAKKGGGPGAGVPIMGVKAATKPLVMEPLKPLGSASSRALSGLPTSLSTGSAGSTGATGMLGKLGKFFGKVDPTALVLGGLSMLGGDDGQERQSFRGQDHADPVQALQEALRGIYRLGAGLEQKGPTRLRSSYVPGSPQPVSVPGIPFQIGGGLAMDPAQRDPSLLEFDNSFMGKFGPFQGLAQNEFAQGGSGKAKPRQAPQGPSRRRQPGGGR